MTNHPAELLLKEIYNDVKVSANGGDMNFYIKPISAGKAQMLLQYVATLNSQLEAYKKSLAIHSGAADKLKKAMAGLESIATSKFPQTAAKSDLLQEHAAKVWSEIQG